MDVSLTSSTATTGSTKPLEPKPDTPSRAIAQPTKPAHFTNGVLKRHNGHAPTIAVAYKECLRNHAVSLGIHALDGCLEFMPSLTSAASDIPTSHECAACGCHRNFHRRETDHPAATPPPLRLEYQSHHRHHPPPPPPPPQPLHPPAPLHSPNSVSAQPISSHPPSSVPHMLLPPQGMVARKRFRTKFSQSQKERMFELAERVGWRMQKRDDGIVREFCNEVGISRSVFKVWMHNNKNTFGKPRIIDHFGNDGRNATGNVNPVGNEDSPH